jgi:hypothetical protein
MESYVEGRTSSAWSDLLETADAALHLHNSPFGHLGPYLHMSLAAGIPTLVLRAAGGEELPSDAVFSISPGLFETAQFVGIFEALSRAGSKNLGEPGRAFIEHEAGVAQVAKQLEATFYQMAPVCAEVLSQWSALYDRADNALVEEIKPLVDTPAPGSPSAYERIILPFVAEVRNFSKLG